MGGEEASFRCLDEVIKEGLSEEMTFALRPAVEGRESWAERPACAKALRWEPSSACVSGV